MKRSRDSEDENDTAGHGEDAALIPVSKILNLDTETELRLEANAIQCSLPGHAKGTSFTNYREYERHYVQVHTNRCLECARNFPSSHVMCLHIHEHHDALAEMKREQGISTYACFVEACKDSFKSYKQRKEHLIKDHAYPHNYFFAVTKFGIDRRQSMLVEQSRGKSNQHKGSLLEKQAAKVHGPKPADEDGEAHGSEDVPMTNASTTKTEQGVVEDEPMVESGHAAGTAPTRDLEAGLARQTSDTKLSEGQAGQASAAVDAELEGITSAMSSLKFVPRAIQLGSKRPARR